MSRNNTTRHTLRNTSHTFVPAERAPQLPATVNPIQVVDILPPAIQSHHTRQDDDAIIAAKATLLVSTGYIVAALLITCGLLLLAWLFKALGEKSALYFVSGLVLWGICILIALYGNRRQSLHHSSSGLGHAGNK